MYGILVDVTLCTACEKCVVACVERNGGNQWSAERDRAVTADGLSSKRLSTIVKVDEGRFARKSCMHCLQPSCVSACLVGGLTKTSEGAVIYDREMCIGCRYCMLACPFHIPRYEWDKTIPYVAKCDLCYDRITKNELPACVNACPENALKFGDRNMLLREAHGLIRKYPDRYKPHVWGEKEFGGTSVMYISDVDMTALGWPEESAAPIPELTEPLVHKTPFMGFGVAIGLVGLNWIIKRRNELARNRDEQQEVEEHSE